MADRLERIAKTIRLVLNKNRKGFIKSDDINTAIQSAETDLYNKLVQLYVDQGFIHSKLVPFLRESSEQLDANGEISMTRKAFKICSAESTVAGKDYPAIIIHDGEGWASKKLSDIMDLEKPDYPNEQYINRIAITADQQVLPENFVKAINGEVVVDYNKDGSVTRTFKSKEVSPDQFNTRDISELTEQEMLDAIKFNISRNLYSGGVTSSGVVLPENFMKEVTFVVTVGGQEYEGKMVKPEVFNSKDIRSLLSSGEFKDHIAIVDTNIVLTSGTGSLPSTFVKDKGVFYTGTGDSRVEGIILDSEEYLDRIQSDLLTPTALDPIGRIVGDTIEVFPTSVTSIKLTHYEYPSEKAPIGTVEGGKFYCKPNNANNVTLVYVADATEERSKFKIQEGKIYIKPSTLATVGTNDNTFTLEYWAFPTTMGSIARLKNTYINEQHNVTFTATTSLTTTITGTGLPQLKKGDVFEIRGHTTAGCNGLYQETGGTPLTTSITATKIDGVAPADATVEGVTFTANNRVLQVKPEAVTDVKVSYIAPLQVSEYVTSVSGRDYVYSNSSRDTVFSEESINDIVSGALQYLGISINDQVTAQFEQIRKQ